MSEEVFIYEAIRTPRQAEERSLNRSPLNLVVGLVDELGPGS
jgi:hypothetical protein